MIAEGYNVIPVNPREKEILGRKCYASLKDIPEAVDIVDIFRDPSAVPAIVEEAMEIGAKVIWMQLGVSPRGGSSAGAIRPSPSRDGCLCQNRTCEIFWRAEYDWIEHGGDQFEADQWR